MRAAETRHERTAARPPAAAARAAPGARRRCSTRCKARFGERCSTALAVREQHGRDESPFDVPPPEAVVFCESTDDVAAVVQLADQHAVPVIPFGVGSSLEGHLLAVQGGISIDLSRMNQVLRVNAEDLTVTVQAGVTRKQLNDEIKRHRPVLPDRPRRRRHRSAAWPPRAPAAPTPCATARCARTCWR